MITSAVDSFTDTYQDTSSGMGMKNGLKTIAHEGNESEMIDLSKNTVKY